MLSTTSSLSNANLANIYFPKVNNRNARRCEIYSKLIIKTPERHVNLHSISIKFLCASRALVQKKYGFKTILFEALLCYSKKVQLFLFFVSSDFTAYMF